MAIVDLSAPIEPSLPGTPDFQRNSIEYFDHQSGAAEIEALFGVRGGCCATARAGHAS